MRGKRFSVLFMLAGFITACLILIGSTIRQYPKWKGTIETENGVKVIKNPREPLYGEVTLELEEDLTIGSEEDDNAYFYRGFSFAVDREGHIYVFDRANFRIQKFNRNGEYLQTIGRRGQGPGEFQELFSFLYLDTECNLYVKGKRRIQVFDKKGEFVTSIPLEANIYKFGVIGKENILTETSSRSENGRIYEIIVLNSKGERIRTLAGLLRPRANIKANVIFLHPYSQNIYFRVLDENLGVYGNSSDYRLYVVDSEGVPVYIIEKEEPSQKITRKEKNKPIDGLIETYRKHDIKIPRGEIEKLANLLEFKPFYSEILTDDLGHIYVKKVGSILVKESEVIYDLFNRDGYYLYKVKMPYLREPAGISPSLMIKNGYIYRGEYDRETMLWFVKRYRIKNWEQMKLGRGVMH